MRCREILALDELHDQRATCRRPSLEAVDLRDVRVVERGERLRLALEAHQAIRIAGERRRQHLDGDVAIELRVAGAIHLAHAARAERAGHLERADPCTARQHRCHRPPS